MPALQLLLLFSVTAMLNDQRPYGRYSGYYDNLYDMNELTNDFNRCTTFAGRNQHVVGIFLSFIRILIRSFDLINNFLFQNKPNDGQTPNRRYNQNMKNPPKSNSKNSRCELSKGKRQFDNTESSSKYQHQQNYNKAKNDYSERGQFGEASPRANEDPMGNFTMTPPLVQMYPYCTDSNDPGNMYGVSYAGNYGIYPQTLNGNESNFDYFCF